MWRITGEPTRYAITPLAQKSRISSRYHSDATRRIRLYTSLFQSQGAGIETRAAH